MKTGRAYGSHKGGVFHIHLADRDRQNAEIQPVALNIDPGSRTSGYAVTRENEDGKERTIIGAHQVRHRAHRIKMSLDKRRMHRRTRRGRLRHRPPRFDNRTKPKGWLAPSIRHLADNIVKNAERITSLYPVSQIRIETTVFDTQAMQNPGIEGTEYQHGTLHSWQLRAYVLHREGNRCAYCGRSNTRLEVEHIVPRSRGGTDHADNLTASCRSCNIAKGQMPIEQFLSDDPKRLTRIMRGRKLTNLADAAHLNIIMPTVLRDLESLGLPLEQTDAARTSWNRRELSVPKSHVADAALLGDCRTLRDLPDLALTIAKRPANGRRFRAQVNTNGTVRGKAWRNYCRLSLSERARAPRPLPSHSTKQKRFGSQAIASGDLVRIRHRQAGTVTGRAVIQNGGTRVRISGTKPALSATIDSTTLLRRDPRFTLTQHSLIQDARGIA